jgi:kynureninase
MGGGAPMPPPDLSREAALAADAADPLASFRDRFLIADHDRLYFDGNSLGRLPLATRERLAALVEEWGERLVSGWPDWIDEPRRVGDLLGAELLGAAPGETLVCDSTTVNLYKLCGALLDGPDPPSALVTDRANFPTDRYVLEGLSASRGLELRLFDGGGLEAALADGPALVVLSHVAYRSGALLDVATTQTLAREHGATVIWDLSHSVGAVPIDLRGAGARLAVGCSYKYLNGGPGAPGWLYVAEELHGSLRSPIQGWFGQADQFHMERPYEPARGIERFLAGTPSILGLAGVEEGARLVAEAGTERLREKSVAQTELARELHQAWLAPLGFTLETPGDPQLRGSHLCLGHAEAWPICRALEERENVIVDFRDPDAIRLGVAPIYTRFVDVWDACDRIRRVVESGEHRGYGAERGRVT